MHLLRDTDNPLTDSDADNQAELHMSAGDVIVIISPQGDELTVSAHPVDGELHIQW